MIKLIVNGDDFGITKGVNRGILEAAKNGILTSTSVMIGRPYANEINEFHQEVPNVGIGIHIEFDKDLMDRCKNKENFDDREITDSIEEQIAKFKELTSFLPDHMDFHKVAIRPSKDFVVDEITVFISPIEKISSKYKIPWRGMEEIKRIDTFHGAIYDPETHKKSLMDVGRISPKYLIEILRNFKDGNYEMMTHPGYADKELVSSYYTEREIEIKTLSDTTVIEEIKRLNIQLVNYSQIR